MTVKRLGVLILLTRAIATPALAADVVTEWNQKTAATQEKAEHPRLFALSMVHVAMYDAINSIQGLYTPYKFKVAAAPSSSPEAAGVAAAHAVLVKLFPDEKANLDSAYRGFSRASRGRPGENPRNRRGRRGGCQGTCVARFGQRRRAEYVSTFHGSRSICSDNASVVLRLGERTADAMANATCFPVPPGAAPDVE